MAPEGREKIGGDFAARPRLRPGRHPSTVALSSDRYELRIQGRANYVAKCGRCRSSLVSAGNAYTGERARVVSEPLALLVVSLSTVSLSLRSLLATEPAQQVEAWRLVGALVRTCCGCKRVDGCLLLAPTRFRNSPSS